MGDNWGHIPISSFIFFETVILLEKMEWKLDRMLGRKAINGMCPSSTHEHDANIALATLSLISGNAGKLFNTAFVKPVGVATTIHDVIDTATKNDGYNTAIVPCKAGKKCGS